MIGGVLLAAGNSSRFGGNKTLAKLPNNVSLVAHCARRLLSAVDALVVVAPTDDSDIRREFSGQQNVQVCGCPESENGMGHSIACGIKLLGEASGWLIALSDMPFIKAKTYALVARALTDGAMIAVPVYDGGRGHPVGFSKSLYSELVALSGDVGARHLIAKYASGLAEVECGDPGIHADVDTPEDLERYTNELFNPRGRK